MYIYYIQMKRIMKCEIDKLIKKDFIYLFIYLLLTIYASYAHMYLASIRPVYRTLELGLN